MKKIYLQIILLIFTSQLIAQPVMTSSVAPEIGESWDITFIDNVSFIPGPGGLNQVWDYSDLELSSAINFEIEILDQNQIPGGSTYPDVDFVWHFPAFNAYNYYTVDEDSISLVAGASIDNGETTFETIFTDPEDGLKFPLNYGDNYDYFSRFDQYLFGNLLNTEERYGNVNVDGFGTIITPDGTYENVLRLIITETSFGITNVQYAWMDVNNFIPVLVYEESNDTEISPTLYFSIPKSTTSTSDINESLAQWNSWYSSEDNSIKVIFENTDAKQIDIFDLNGKLLQSFTPGLVNSEEVYSLPLATHSSQQLLIISVHFEDIISSRKIPIFR